MLLSVTIAVIFVFFADAVALPNPNKDGILKSSKMSAASVPRVHPIMLPGHLDIKPNPKLYRRLNIDSDFTSAFPRPKDELSSTALRLMLSGLLPWEKLNAAAKDEITAHFNPRTIDMLVADSTDPHHLNELEEVAVLRWSDECNMAMINFFLRHAKTISKQLFGKILIRAVSVGCLPLFHRLSGDIHFPKLSMETGDTDDSPIPLKAISFAIVLDQPRIVDELLRLFPIYTKAPYVMMGAERRIFDGYKEKPRIPYTFRKYEGLDDACREKMFSSYLCYKLVGQNHVDDKVDPSMMTDEVFAMALPKIRPELKSQWLGTVCEQNKLKLLLVSGVKLDSMHVMKQIDACGAYNVEVMLAAGVKDTSDRALLKALFRHARNSFLLNSGSVFRRNIQLMLEGSDISHEELAAIATYYGFDPKEIMHESWQDKTDVNLFSFFHF